MREYAGAREDEALDFIARKAFRDAVPECVKLFETSFAKECYAAMGSGGLMKTVGARAGGSGVPFTKRDGLCAYAA